VIDFACVTLRTAYANAAWLRSVNVNVAVPTGVAVTFAGSNGVALNAGSRVRVERHRGECADRRRYWRDSAAVAQRNR
jgi:hypothetical protein